MLQHDNALVRKAKKVQTAVIGADLHRAMVATAPKEELLIGRRPVRNWAQLQFFFFVSLAINDTSGNAVRYQTSFCAENYACSSENSTAYGAAYSLQKSPIRPIYSCIYATKGREGREFVLCPRKKKEKSAPMTAIAECGFQEMNHPQYSPDLAPCDHFQFRKLKKALAWTSIFK